MLSCALPPMHCNDLLYFYMSVAAILLSCTFICCNNTECSLQWSIVLLHECCCNNTEFNEQVHTWTSTMNKCSCKPLLDDAASKAASAAGEKLQLMPDLFVLLVCCLAVPTWWLAFAPRCRSELQLMPDLFVDIRCCLVLPTWWWHLNQDGMLELMQMLHAPKLQVIASDPTDLFVDLRSSRGWDLLQFSPPDLILSICTKMQCWSDRKSASHCNAPTQPSLWSMALQLPAGRHLLQF